MKMTEAEEYGNLGRSSRMFSMEVWSEKHPFLHCQCRKGRDRVFETTMLERVTHAKKEIKSGGVETGVGSGDVYATAIALPRDFGIQRQMRVERVVHATG
jgi:hypothetical protein